MLKHPPSRMGTEAQREQDAEQSGVQSGREPGQSLQNLSPHPHDPLLWIQTAAATALSLRPLIPTMLTLYAPSCV